MRRNTIQMTRKRKKRNVSYDGGLGLTVSHITFQSLQPSERRHPSRELQPKSTEGKENETPPLLASHENETARKEKARIRNTVLLVA